MELIHTDTKIIEDSIKVLLETIGEDVNREGLQDTPRRIINAMSELFVGYKQNPEDILKVQFVEFGNYDEIILLKDIDFYSFCEHHCLPFYGTVSVGYIPTDKIVGLSKMARLVEVFARRLQIQERFTTQISKTLNKVLRPKGVAVVVKGKHLCMGMRGVKKANAEMVTSSMLGVFKEKPEARAEFLELIK